MKKNFFTWIIVAFALVLMFSSCKKQIKGCQCTFNIRGEYGYSMNENIPLSIMQSDYGVSDCATLSSAYTAGSGYNATNVRCTEY